MGSVNACFEAVCSSVASAVTRVSFAVRCIGIYIVRNMTTTDQTTDHIKFYHLFSSLSIDTSEHSL